MDRIIEQVFSFYFYAIHLPPAEEGEFLLYYDKPVIKNAPTAIEISIANAPSLSIGFTAPIPLSVPVLPITFPHAS